jgi:hypothetical protein
MLAGQAFVSRQLAKRAAGPRPGDSVPGLRNLVSIWPETACYAVSDDRPLALSGTQEIMRG